MKIIALIGKSSAGKDLLLRIVAGQNPNLHEIISCTSRPPRSNETQGVNYHFISDKEFEEMIADGQMLECTVFNGWYYGTAFNDLDKDKINIGVFNPAGIKMLRNRKDVELKVFYITANDKSRVIRQLQREENPNIEEVFRRYLTDKEDFSHLDFPYTEIENTLSATLAAAELQDKISQLEWR